MKVLTLTRHEDLLAVLTPGEINAEQTRFLLSRRGQLAEELSKLTGRSIRIELILAGQNPSGDPSNPNAGALPPRANIPISLQDAMTLPLVRQVMDHFNASIMEVRRDESNLPPKTLSLPDPDADITMIDISPDDAGMTEPD